MPAMGNEQERRPPALSGPSQPRARLWARTCERALAHVWAISCSTTSPRHISRDVQEVPSDEPGVRVFVVLSDERLAYERSQRLISMERVRVQLEALQKRVASSHLKAPEKIGAAAARILARSHGQRYFDWVYEDGHFRHHQTADRVKAHIQVAALAFLLHRALEKRLEAARLDISATAAWQALRSVRLVEIDLGDGSTKRSVTRGTARAAAILKALGIAELHPPTPSMETSVLV